MSTKKICTKCNIEKELTNFYKTKKGKYGHDSTCIVCRRIWQIAKYRKDIHQERKRHLIKYHSENEEKRNHRLEIARSWSKTKSGIYNTYRKRAKKRKMDFELSFVQFSEIIGKDCVYCGEIGYGIDRKDNNKGYTQNNSVTACGMCNKMKLTMTTKEFAYRCKRIYERLNNL